MTERLDVIGFTLQRLEEHVKRRLKAEQTELDGRIEYYEQEVNQRLAAVKKLPGFLGSAKGGPDTDNS